MPPPAKPAPLAPPIRDIDGDELADALPHLIELAHDIRSRVTFEEISGGAHGYYQPCSRRIVIEARMSTNQQVKTLCHELGHALARTDHLPEDPELDYAAEELVAESVAFTCLGALGISTEAYSIPYIASWAENCEPGELEHAAALIDRLARRIENAAVPVPS